MAREQGGSDCFHGGLGGAELRGCAGKPPARVCVAAEGAEPQGAFPGQNGRPRASALPLGIAQIVQRAGGWRGGGGFPEKTGCLFIPARKIGLETATEGDFKLC